MEKNLQTPAQLDNQPQVLDNQPVVLTPEQKIAALEAELKKLKEDKKSQSPRKGAKVSFKNTKDETIVGWGQLYYCVNINGKLHYKQLAQVEILEAPKAHMDEILGKFTTLTTKPVVE